MFIKFLILIAFFANFLFASLPSCKYGTYNQEKKACVINMSCPSGQTLSLGKCIVDPINIKDEYTFSSNNDNCSTYKDIKDKLPSKKIYHEGVETVESVKKIKSYITTEKIISTRYDNPVNGLCVNGTLEGSFCKVQEEQCPASFSLINNVCSKEVFSCPITKQYLDSGEFCTLTNISCPQNTVLESGKCVENVPEKCPVGYLTDGSKCSKVLENPNCKKNPTCNSDKITCPINSYLSDGLCIAKVNNECQEGFVYNNEKKVCETEGICKNGYVLDLNGNCIFNYEYSLYSCPSGMVGPIDPGLDCLGSNKICNPSTPPGANCKKEFKEGINDITITKHRAMIGYTVYGGGAFEANFGSIKGFNCGYDCLFYIREIVGDGESLLFKKNNGEVEKLRVPGCSFTGTIRNDSRGKLDDIRELLLLNQYTITLGNGDTKNKIVSNCKMNGHVGWYGRNAGIDSILVDPKYPDTIKFWDSYLDGDIGFIEFVKDVKEKDRADGYIPEFNFLYEMLAIGFTGQSAIGKHTIYVSGEEMSSSQCQKIADDMGIYKASASTPEIVRMIKMLSGNRMDAIVEYPRCDDKGEFSEDGKACLIPTDVYCGGKYTRVARPGDTYIFESATIWDDSQGGNTATFSHGFYLPEDMTLKVLAGSLSSFGDIYVNDQKITNYPLWDDRETMEYIFLKKGYHNIRVVGHRNMYSGPLAYIGAGIAVRIFTQDGRIITSSEEWCKSPSCPAGYSMSKGSCFKATASYCEVGKVDPSTNKCIIGAKCVLVDNSPKTFREQVEAYKTIVHSNVKEVLKCSPLKCVTGECKTAVCPFDVNGKQYSGNIFPHYDSPKPGDCTNQLCDGNRPYYEYCGKPGGCNKSDPLVYEDSSGNCHQLYCPAGQIMDIERKVCKKLGCPDGTVPKGDACVQK